jgi:phage-related protein
MMLLADYGVLLSEPHSRQLRGKLRELRFNLDGDAIRVTYFAWRARTIVLLTVFRKSNRREPREVERAERAMIQWLQE